MCATCGCEGDGKTTLLNLQTGREARIDAAHDHGAGETHHHHERGSAEPADHHQHLHHHHDHFDQNEHVHADGTRHSHPHHAAEAPDIHAASEGGASVALDARILAKNDALASRNRAWFAGREILALNLVSSPGSGKTTLLERTIKGLAEPIFVIEGDQATARDGERIRAAGAPAVQVNTGSGCHLDAAMVARALAELRPSVGSLALIENVGNLVCPALFDLGERAKVVIFSTTEGDDKPLKYPHMFRAAKLAILNKIDLLPYVDFDVARAIANARRVNPDLAILEVSARTGEGLDAWFEWLRRQALAARQAAFA